jgi:hypothetical protein
MMRLRFLTWESSVAANPPDELDLWLEEYFEKHFAKKAWDKEHTYVIDIIKILHGRKWGVRKVDLDAALHEKRFADGEPIPKTFEKAIQSVLNQYTSQSNEFKKKNKLPEDDLFYSPKGKFSGTWAVHEQRALAWLKKKIGKDL